MQSSLIRQIRSPNLFKNLLQLHRAESNAVNIAKLEAESADVGEVIDEEAERREANLQSSRNKSGLNPHHRNLVNDSLPYKEAQLWTHGTLSYQRKMYARFGQESSFDPALCWTKEELAQKKEYEAVAHPYTIPQMIEMAQIKRRERDDYIQKKQAEVVENLKKNQMWMIELKKKYAKKEAEALEAKAKKDRLIEEVRRHFGYTVDPREERFQEMLEKKEKEQKKAMKEARKKAKEEVMMAKLKTIGDEAAQASKENKSKTEATEEDDDDDTEDIPQRKDKKNKS